MIKEVRFASCMGRIRPVRSRKRRSTRSIPYDSVAGSVTGLSPIAEVWVPYALVRCMRLCPLLLSQCELKLGPLKVFLCKPCKCCKAVLQGHAIVRSAANKSGL